LRIDEPISFVQGDDYSGAECGMNVSNIEKAVEISNKLGMTKHSKDAFMELCQRGCDPTFLSERLFRLRSTTQAQIVTTLGKGAVRRTTKHLTSVRPRDSVKTSLGGFKPKDLKLLQEQLINLAHTIESLSYSVIVSEVLKDYSYDIRNLPELLLRYANEILPVVIDRTKKTGAKHKPDYNRNLREMVEHIESATGEPNYRLIADILEGIGIDTNEEAVKQNIYRHRSDKGGNVK
jgi:hypothetical protein